MGVRVLTGAEIGTTALIGSALCGVSAFVWTATPFVGGVLFGATAPVVGGIVFYATGWLSQSQILNIARVALALFAGITAGMAAASFGGVILTLDAAGSLIAASCLTAVIFLKATQR